MSALTFLLLKLNRLQKNSPKFESAEAMVQWQWCVKFTPQLLHHDNDVKEVVSSQPSITFYKSTNQKIGIPAVYEIWKINSDSG